MSRVKPVSIQGLTGSRASRSTRQALARLKLASILLAWCTVGREEEAGWSRFRFWWGGLWGGRTLARGGRNNRLFFPPGSADTGSYSADVIGNIVAGLCNAVLGKWSMLGRNKAPMVGLAVTELAKALLCRAGGEGWSCGEPRALLHKVRQLGQQIAHGGGAAPRSRRLGRRSPGGASSVADLHKLRQASCRQGKGRHIITHC